MDGMELAEILKAHPETATIALFLLSSSGGRLGAGRGSCAGLRRQPDQAGPSFRTVRLPDHRPEQRGTGGPGATQARPTNPSDQEVKGMILLVEDNKMNQLVGSKVLAKLGYAFEVANHGGEARRRHPGRRYDAVLMDCQMPEMDGYQATAEIRRIEGSGPPDPDHRHDGGGHGRRP